MILFVVDAILCVVAAYCAVASKSFVTVSGKGGFQPMKVQPTSALTDIAGNATPLVSVLT